MHLTAQDLRKFGIIDEIIAEPIGGAHRNHAETINHAKDVILRHLQELSSSNGNDLKKKRTEKFMKMGRKFARSE